MDRAGRIKKKGEETESKQGWRLEGIFQKNEGSHGHAPGEKEKYKKQRSGESQKNPEGIHLKLSAC